MGKPKGRNEREEVSQSLSSFCSYLRSIKHQLDDRPGVLLSSEYCIFAVSIAHRSVQDGVESDSCTRADPFSAHLLRGRPQSLPMSQALLRRRDPQYRNRRPTRTSVESSFSRRRRLITRLPGKFITPGS